MARDYFEARSVRHVVVPYDSLTAELNDSGTVEVVLALGRRSIAALVDLNAVTRAACELLISKKRKNGFAVLELYDGEYFLRTLFENGREVNLYFPDDEKKGGKKR